MRPLHPGERNIVRQALKILAERHKKGEAFHSPADTRTYLQLRLAENYNEVFGVIFLTQRHAVIAMEELFYGTIDGTTVHSRVVVQKALLHNAAAVVLYHNHPSGVAEPSKADETITQRIKDALGLVDVRVIDHFVVTAQECLSFAERGLL